MCPWQEQPRKRQHGVGLSAVGGGGGWGGGREIWMHLLVLPLISRVKVQMEKLILVSQGCGEDECDTVWKVCSRRQPSTTFAFFWAPT